ncbi:hypothetical protein CAPTEDRAFT_216776 [Capitella teleta]|uniref:ZSWIM1/3 RNaseH-like domain-containing protein n=1 Tax=Capitella teleta TaxID=283909 RepID=R7UZF6_CAPTE|nr:hypothetical protein CAPTEDRAFT_216776 [Capitella teleta]|eukprot:ELU11968.1 hypothetical protein CAPTEDRAFT_216776 [Capitella teleta]
MGRIWKYGSLSAIMTTMIRRGDVPRIISAEKAECGGEGTDSVDAKSWSKQKSCSKSSDGGHKQENEVLLLRFWQMMIMLCKGHFFKLVKLKLQFASYPELIFDATYKLNDHRMPLVVMLAENSNGESEVVSLWIVQNEELGIIMHMMCIFKRNNLRWTETKCVMADKDMVERKVVKEEMPQADLLICLFHSLKVFRTQITMAKYAIDHEFRLKLLTLLQDIAYSGSEEQYQERYSKFVVVTSVVPAVVEYYHHC